MIQIKDYDEAELILAANKEQLPKELWNLVPKTAANVYYDYQESKELGLDMLNIRRLENIPATVQELRRLGISMFTITDSFSNLLERLFELSQNGVKIIGLWKVTTHPVDDYRVSEEVPGLLLKVI